MRRAGLLNEIIEIHRLQINKSEYGEEETSYTKISTIRAHLVEDKGDRILSNSEITYNYQKIFMIRFYVDIVESDRIFWNKKFYRVLEIVPNRAYQEKKIRLEVINE